ncbi:MAG TPA: hypothetical protein VF834_25655 [Streptosporangiaceae bacterium]
MLTGRLAVTTARFHVPADSCQTRLCAGDGTQAAHVKQLATAHSPPWPSKENPVTAYFRDDATAGSTNPVQVVPFQCPTASVVPFLLFLTAPPTQMFLSPLATTLPSPDLASTFGTVTACHAPPDQWTRAPRPGRAGCTPAPSTAHTSPLLTALLLIGLVEDVRYILLQTAF